eukprot:TRINITY_DN4531_c0_g1_i1.p1 TRINITY_DN4531_c0_g1~~TRINITY_DN4531_c0_g1_i1.p1  ORF type:complete len:632 (+),score=137.38 TRINITY_DN4531_c0_g1_i1:42-1898(+)
MNYLTHVASGLFNVFKPNDGKEEIPSELLKDGDDLGAVNCEPQIRAVKWKGTVGVYKKSTAPGVYTQIVEKATMELIWSGARSYSIVISSTGEDKPILTTPIGEGLSITYHTETCSAMFTSILEGDEDIMEWSAIMLADDPDRKKQMLDKFLEAYNACSYNVYYQPGDSDEDRDNDEQDEPDPVLPDDRSSIWCGGVCESLSPCRSEELFDCEEEDEHEGNEKKTAKSDLSSTDRNITLSDLAKPARLVVLKDRPEYGSVIGVYPYAATGFDDLNTVEISGLKWDGSGINARELVPVPHDDSKVLLLDPDAPCGGVYMADITQEKIITTYAPGADLDLSINHILPTATDAHPHLVTCLVNTAVFGMDTRAESRKCGILNEKGVTQTVMDWGLSLSTKKRLTCHATAPDGKLAVGSYTGDIRLYSGTPGTKKSVGSGVHPKTAKTLLEGFGQPVKHLDMTKKGDWLVATLDSFLVLMNLTFVDDKDAERNGCQTPMGKKKPKPIKLSLGLKSMKEIGLGQTFKCAKFEKLDPSSDCEESRIVATIGNVLVSWNLSLIKKDKERGTELVSMEHDKAPLVDIAASRDDSGVKYITENSVSMATPKTQKPHLAGKKFTISFQ